MKSCVVTAATLPALARSAESAVIQAALQWFVLRRELIMGAVEGLQKRKVLLEVTLLDEDDLTDEEARQTCSTASGTASAPDGP